MGSARGWQWLLWQLWWFSSASAGVERLHGSTKERGPSGGGRSQGTKKPDHLQNPDADWPAWELFLENSQENLIHPWSDYPWSDYPWSMKINKNPCLSTAINRHSAGRHLRHAGCRKNPQRRRTSIPPEDGWFLILSDKPKRWILCIAILNSSPRSSKCANLSVNSCHFPTFGRWIQNFVQRFLLGSSSPSTKITIFLLIQSGLELLRSRPIRCVRRRYQKIAGWLMDNGKSLYKMDENGWFS